MEWVTIDFEASCLPRHGRSYPIEIGVAGPQGTRAWLIRPLPAWHDWDWTEQAARLHGITRDQLDAEGIDPAQVLAEVLSAIGTARIIADSPIDAQWWQQLVDAAGGTAAPIRIEQVGDVLDELGASPTQIQFAQRRADWLCPDRHRAGADARWLHTLLTTAEQRIAEDREMVAEAWPSEIAGDFAASAPRAKAR